MNRWRIVLLVAGLFLLQHLTAYGQATRGSRSVVSQNLTYLSWELSGDTTKLTVSQLFAPVLLNLRLGDGWSLGLWSAASRSSSDRGASPDISGLNDSKIQLTHTMADGQFLLSVGASLPTGKTELSATERELIPWLSADFFNFPVKIPGEGLELFGETGIAVPVSSWVFGVAGAVHYFEKYTPYNDNREYQPGMRIVGTTGIGRDWAERGHIGLDLLAIYSLDDKVEGNARFGDGLQLDGRLVVQRNFPKGGVDVMARFIQRGRDRILASSSPDPASESSKSHGNDLRFHCLGRHIITGRLQGWVSLDLKMLMANGYAGDNPLFQDAARISGFGGGLDMRLGRHSTVGLGARYWTGSSDGAYAREKLDLSGFEIVQRLTISL